MRIAVIGTGIAGLGAAYALSRRHEVVLFERNTYAGGHTNTVSVQSPRGELPLDTGFIVHNERNYPNLARLFRELGVVTRESDMSFSVTCARCQLEYSGRRPLASPANAVRPGFIRLLRDVARFLRQGPELLERDWAEEATLSELVERQGYSRELRDHFLVPLTAAIWSTAPAEALGFPAGYALRFFENHGMLGFRRERWRTVVDGSRTYVRALLERIGTDRLHIGVPVAALRRTADGVELATGDGATKRFDAAVVATHPDEALALLAQPTPDERRVLGAFRYTCNETVLHTDDRLLPRRRAARASWNFHLADCRNPGDRPTITYSCNRLQGLAEPEEYCVTLNRGRAIREDRVITRMTYEHPLYTFESLKAQAELPGLNVDRLAYCGAYQGYGFHEDGLTSGLAAAAVFGAAP